MARRQTSRYAEKEAVRACVRIASLYSEVMTKQRMLEYIKRQAAQKTMVPSRYAKACGYARIVAKSTGSTTEQVLRDCGMGEA